MSKPERPVYLDHNASSPLLSEAREAMARALDGAFGNPSSPHRFGHRAKLVLESARAQVASLLGARTGRIVFVSGGTEADNLAVQGTARAWIASGRPPGRIVTSDVEHPAVLEACRYLEASGWQVTRLAVDADGRVDPQRVEDSLDERTALISIMAANNETGVLQPVEAIGGIARRAGVAFHVDAVQAVGRVRFDPVRTGATLVSLSSHKLGGPAGIGALYAAEPDSIRPLMLGGAQESRLRAGSEAPFLAAGFGAAAGARHRALSGASAPSLRDLMEHRLARAIPGLVIHAVNAPRLPNTTSVAIPGVDREALVIRMDLAGFAISTGAACSTGAARPSHVLAAMGVDPAIAACTVRVSLGAATSLDEIERFCEAMTAAALQPRPDPVGAAGSGR